MLLEIVFAVYTVPDIGKFGSQTKSASNLVKYDTQTNGIKWNVIASFKFLKHEIEILQENCVRTS